MGLMRDIMNDAMDGVIDVLGDPAVWINTGTGDATTIDAIIDTTVKVFESGVFVGTVTVATVHARHGVKVGDTLTEQSTSITYQLDSIKTATPTKLAFYASTA